MPDRPKNRFQSVLKAGNSKIFQITCTYGSDLVPKERPSTQLFPARCERQASSFHSLRPTIFILVAEFWIAFHVGEDFRTSPPARALHTPASHVEGVEAKHVEELSVYLAEDLEDFLFRWVELPKSKYAKSGKLNGIISNVIHAKLRGYST